MGPNVGLAYIVNGPAPQRVAFEAGATLQSEATVSGALMPGQLISQAIQEAAFGATIQLGPGIHILSAPLSLKSGITLAGVGRATVVFLDAKRKGPAISSDDPALHDVTIRNLMIEAGTLQAPSRDPN